MQVRKQQLEMDVEQTGSKLGKEYVKAVYCHHVYLIYTEYIMLSFKCLRYKKCGRQIAVFGVRRLI